MEHSDDLDLHVKTPFRVHRFICNHAAAAAFAAAVAGSAGVRSSPFSVGLALRPQPSGSRRPPSSIPWRGCCGWLVAAFLASCRRAVVNDDDVAPGMEVLCGFFDAVSCCRPSTLMNSPAAPPRPLRATTWRWLAYRQQCHGRRRGMLSLGLTGAPKPGWPWQPFALPSDFCVERRCVRTVRTLTAHAFCRRGQPPRQERPNGTLPIAFTAGTTRPTGHAAIDAHG